MRLFQLVKQRSGELALRHRKALFLAKLDQLGVIADIDDPKGVVVAYAKGEFTGYAFKVLDMQRTPGRCIE